MTTPWEPEHHRLFDVDTFQRKPIVSDVRGRGLIVVESDVQEVRFHGMRVFESSLDYFDCFHIVSQKMIRFDFQLTPEQRRSPPQLRPISTLSKAELQKFEREQTALRAAQEGRDFFIMGESAVTKTAPEVTTETAETTETVTEGTTETTQQKTTVEETTPEETTSTTTQRKATTTTVTKAETDATPEETTEKVTKTTVTTKPTTPTTNEETTGTTEAVLKRMFSLEYANREEQLDYQNKPTLLLYSSIKTMKLHFNNVFIFSGCLPSA